MLKMKHRLSMSHPYDTNQDTALKPSNKAINLPNMLTVARILMIPLFVILLLRGSFLHALLVFTIAGISDALDGLLARLFNQRTVLGAYLDPIADKLLLTSAFISLALLHSIPGWLAVIVISRDILIILGIAIFTITDIKVKIRPTLVSKFTTFTQLLTVFFTLLNPELAGAVTIKQTLFWATAVVTVLSGLHYIYIGMNILHEASGNNHAHR